MRMFEYAARHGLLIFTDNTRRELIATMLSSKFDRYANGSKREAFLLALAPIMEMVQVVQLVRLCRDPFDDAVLEAALNGRAEAVVTGDKDLLSLHPFKGIPILTSAGYLAHVAKGQ
jgi:putative PIN family toxin of toxin-antitoxin system